MIKFWVDQRIPFYINKTLDNGFIDLTLVELSYELWFNDVCRSSVINVKVRMDLLNRGYEI